MNSRTESKIPFVGLHAHSVAGSPFDALGYPPEHMDFAYENGMDALALTDHGNMNGLAWQVLHAKKMKKAGKEFKPIFGVEAYFLPSIEEWRGEYNRIKEDAKYFQVYSVQQAHSIRSSCSHHRNTGANTQGQLTMGDILGASRRNNSLLCK